jgi:acyl dehydratase
VTTVVYGDLSAVVGQEFGPSKWIDIPQRDVDAFGRITRDLQWIHVDAARAADGPFHTTIAHGFFTVSLLTAVVQEVFVVEGTRMAINYGLDKVRFPAPVTVGSRVRGSCVVVALHRVAGGSQATIRVTIEADTQAKPVCVADFLIRYLEDDQSRDGAEASGDDRGILPRP